ncbi:DUF3833 domain-containing protein [Nitrincola tapanii]|uniref:DUF3833 domain-containing protein n=1 Tax=Nitrincola tapanii TaxID=1708751 RepID=A0A5A9W4P7_9GAMM|nr:DUF3833 domain-containing protein [Nitrincola tapanii]KAA0875697.1 DUF3833 domain-containing protein [Nitrincola tapanii]
MRQLLLIAILSLTLSGCSKMSIEDFESKQPTLVLEEYFQGSVYAWGIFEDRFGKLRREFQVEILGEWNGETLVLDEYFLYSDGERDRRVWTITPLDGQRYQGSAADIIGYASGEVRGNALNWQYKMDLKVGDGSWRVHFDDWMYLQPGGVMVNRAKVSKWGVELGSVTLFFTRGDQLKEAPFALKASHPHSDSN